MYETKPYSSWIINEGQQKREACFAGLKAPGHNLLKNNFKSS